MARPVNHFQLCKDILHVDFDGVLGDTQSRADFFVSQALGHPLQDFQFTCAEGYTRRMVRQAGGDFRGNAPLARTHVGHDQIDPFPIRLHP